MSNEIAQRDEQQAVATTQQPANTLPAPAPTAGSTALMAWAQEADLAYQMAQKLAATSFVPQSLRGKPGDITAAILAGSELGLKPMATLKSIDVIQGTPALRAHAMRAVVQKRWIDGSQSVGDDGPRTLQRPEWRACRQEHLSMRRFWPYILEITQHGVSHRANQWPRPRPLRLGTFDG